MRVVLDATGLGSGAGGDETMLTGVLSGLALVARPDDAFVVVATDGVALPAGVEEHPSVVVRRVRRFPGIVHHLVVLPWVVGRTAPRPDLVFAPTHGPAWTSVPVCLMVQDLSFEHHPEYYPPVARFRLRQVVPRQARRARVVLTVSEHARQDLITTYGLEPARVFHVPNAAIEPTSVSAEARGRCRGWLERQGVDGPYFLYLGNLHPRKNVARAVQAFCRLRQARPDLDDHRLVIAGGRWWGSSEEQAALDAAPEGSVVSVGRVDEQQREVLLDDAVALVYVSLFEGFGLPPLEAMNRGTPVVASNVTSIPEVVGDAGILVDPLDIEAISDALVVVATDAERRAELIERGHRRAATYTTYATGASLRAAFAAAIDSPAER